MENEENIEQKYEALKNSKFKQAKLPGWRPVSSIKKTTIIFFVFGGIFIILGIIVLIVCNQVEEVSVRYDDKCKKQKKEENETCTITFNIEEKMEKTIMIYYELRGFYQNHRRYVKSKSDDQLNGKYISLAEMKDKQDCDPVITNADMNKKRAYNDTGDLNPNDIAIPCGLIAKSFFNDNYINWKIVKKNDELDYFSPNETGIASEADKEIKFKNYNLSLQWMNMEDEHFIVWMRPAALPNFRKLWGKIEDRDLEKDTKITVQIIDNFDVSSFDGEKHLILATTNSFGGKNLFIGISYIVLGILSAGFGIVFVLGIKIREFRKNK